MGEVYLQEYMHKKKSYRMKHNARDEYLEAYFLHHLFMLELF
jgi:hypothetical protein